jgi:hypothetical protein
MDSSSENQQPHRSSEVNFSHSLLDYKISERLEAALDYVHGLTVAEVASIHEERLTTEVERFAIMPPRVQCEQFKRDERTVELVDESFDRKTGRTGHCFLIPVEGEVEWLEEISSQVVSSDGCPLAFIDKKQNWIYIKLTLSPHDPEGTLKHKLEHRLKIVEDYAIYTEKRITAFNTELAGKMAEAVISRSAANEKPNKKSRSLGYLQLRTRNTPRERSRSISSWND